MKKSGISICFAVFAAILMLMTTCIVQPVQAEVTNNAIELAEQQMENTINNLLLKIKSDLYIQRLASTYTYPNLKQITYLSSYIKTKYSSDMQNINVKSNEYLTLVLKQYETTKTVTNDYSLDAIPLPELQINNDDYYSTDSDMLSSEIQTISTVSSSNILLSSEIKTISSIDSSISFTPESNVLPSDSTQGHWAGFLRNMNGQMYIPGTGWVYPTEKWLSLEADLKAGSLVEAQLMIQYLQSNGPQPADGPFDWLIQLLEAILNWVSNVLPDIIQGINDAINNFVNGIIDAIQQFFEDIWYIFYLIGEIIEEIINAILGGGVF